MVIYVFLHLKLFFVKLCFNLTVTVACDQKVQLFVQIIGNRNVKNMEYR